MNSEDDSSKTEPVKQPQSDPVPVNDRRSFLTGVVGSVGVVATGAALTVAAHAMPDSERNAQVKRQILSRIQNDLASDNILDPLAYDKGIITHDKYTGS